MILAWKAIALRHSVAILLALFCGVCVALPTLWVVRGLGESSVVIYPEIHNDQLYYAARIQEVLEGRVTLANPYFLEHKTSPWVQLWVPDALIGGGLMLLGVTSAYPALVYMGFVVPPVLFVLMYACAYMLTRSRIAAILGASLFMFGYAVSDLGRTPSPQLNLVFLLSFFGLFFSYLEKRDLWRLIGSGMLLGVLSYIYFFFWTYALVYVGIWVLYALFVDRDRVLGLLGVLAVSVAVSGYYIAHTLTLSHLPYFAETSLRLGVIHSRFPSALEIVMVGGVVTLASLVWYARERAIPPRAFLAAAFGVVAGPLVANHHMITGINLEFSSHYLLPFWLCVMLLCSVVFAQLLKAASRARGEWLYMGAVFLVTAYCTWSVGGYVVQNLRAAPSAADMQRYRVVFAWLETRAPRDAVVLANEHMSTYIPAYTRANVVFAPHASLFYAPTHELWRRVIITDWWEPGTPAYVRQLNAARSLAGVHFINDVAHKQSIYRLYDLFGIAHEPLEEVPEVEVRAFLTMHGELHQRAYDELLRELNVSYLIWDRREDPQWRPFEMPFLKEEARLDSFVIYSLQ